jgi:hypothetical protein
LRSMKPAALKRVSTALTQDLDAMPNTSHSLA